MEINNGQFETEKVKFQRNSVKILIFYAEIGAKLAKKKMQKRKFSS